MLVVVFLLYFFVFFRIQQRASGMVQRLNLNLARSKFPSRQRLATPWTLKLTSSTWSWSVVVIQSVPGVGGNSTMEVVLYVITIFFVLLISPPVISVFLDLLNDPTRAMDVMETLARNNRYINMLWLNDTGCPLDLVRVILGNISVFWLILDDFAGPGKMLNAIYDLRKKGDKKDRGIAPIYNSMVWRLCLLDFGIALFSSNVFKVCTMILSALITYYLWKSVGESTWVARGHAIHVTSGCESLIWLRKIWLEAPAQLRIMIVKLCMLGNIVSFVTKNIKINVETSCWMVYVGVEIIVAALTIILATIKENHLAIAMGILSNNLTLFLLGFGQKPFTGSLMRSSKYG